MTDFLLRLHKPSQLTNVASSTSQITFEIPLDGKSKSSRTMLYLSEQP